MGVDTLRAFVAARLPPELGERYVSLQRALGDVGSVKWVELWNLHLTLKFLGNVAVGDLPRLEGALARAAAEGSPAVLSPRRLSAFPSPHAARVLVLELEDRGGRLGALQRAIEHHLVAAGAVPEEREFRVHLTLGRSKAGKLDVRAALARPPLPEHEWGVESFELVESRLGSRGPAYTALASFALTRGSRDMR